MFKNRWKVVAVVTAAFAAGVLAASVVWAAGGVTKVSGGAITNVAIARGSTSAATTSTSWVNIPNASVTITVPAGHRAILLATLSGESICQGGSVADECDVRIMAGTKQFLPGPAAPNSGAAFDSVGTSGNDYREIHSVQRSLGPLSAGKYTVRVQWETCCGTTFTLSDWNLTVEEIRTS
jgi:hypothetical protein